MFLSYENTHRRTDGRADMIPSIGSVALRVQPHRHTLSLSPDTVSPYPSRCLQQWNCSRHIMCRNFSCSGGDRSQEAKQRPYTFCPPEHTRHICTHTNIETCRHTQNEPRDIIRFLDAVRSSAWILKGTTWGCLSVSYLPTYLSACLPTYLPTHPPIPLPTYLDIFISTYPSTYLSIYPPTYLSIYTYLPTYLPTYLSIYLSLYAYLHIFLPNYLPTYPSTHPSTYLSRYLPIHLPTYLSIHLSTYLSIPI